MKSQDAIQPIYCTSEKPNNRVSHFFFKALKEMDYVLLSLKGYNKQHQCSQVNAAVAIDLLIVELLLIIELLLVNILLAYLLSNVKE